jgi:hypothetical protein
LARKLELDVTSKSNDAGLRSAAREVDRLARAADDMAGEFRQAERAASSLDRKLLETRAAAALLAKEFAKTGDVGIRKQLDAQRVATTELKRLRADIIGSTESDAKRATSAWSKASADLKKALSRTSEEAGVSSSKTFASAFQGGILNAFKSPQGIAAISAAVAVLAVPIGAVIGGAVLAGAGVGGAALAGFAATQADQQGRIAAAGNDLLATASKQITTGGQSAIKPLLDGIRELKLGLADVHLDRMIESAAKFIQPLAAGAARFATYIGQAGQALIDAGGPAVKVLAEELPALGRAVKSAFDDIAGGSEGGTRALQDTLRALESFIITTGRIIGFLERAYGAIRNFGDGFESFLSSAREANPILNGLLAPTAALLDVFDTGKERAAQYGHSLSAASQEAAVLADQAKKTAEDIQSISTAFTNLGQSSAGALTNQILSSMFALDEATLSYEESLNGLNAAVKENGKSLAGNSEKALANKQALLAAAEANAALYSQNLLAGDSAEVAGQKYAVNAARLRAQAVAAGFNAGEVDKLIGKYGAVPARVQTILATIGLTEALNKLGQILIDFRNLDGRAFASKYTVTYVTNHVTHYDSTGQPGNSRQAGFALGGMRKAAAGMFIPSRAPGSVLVGEPQTAPGEMLIPLGGLTRQRALTLTKPVADAYGLDVAPRSPSMPNWGGGGSPPSAGRTATSYSVHGLEALFMSWLLKQVQDGAIPLALA